MLSFTRIRTQPRSNRSMSLGGGVFFHFSAVAHLQFFLLMVSVSVLILFLCFSGMEYTDPKKKSNLCGKILMVSTLTALCILMLKQSPNFNTPSQVIYVYISIFLSL